MAKIDGFFRLMNIQGASDLHMYAGHPPLLRIRGELERVKFKELSNDELKEILYEITPEDKIKLFEETGDVDFAYELPGIGRFRANLFRQANGIAGVFRQIPSEILTLDQLGMPHILRRFASMEKGLVLVTGPTGSGKSTTLAAMVDYANKTRKHHIITLEDPIEFMHPSINCTINHREIGYHTKSFAGALRATLREDPDIILVGEMRDLETISLAIEAALTGHLVLSTLHTQDAVRTIDRIVDIFPADTQPQIRSTLSETLKGVIAQALLKRLDERGRIAVLEILLVTTAVAHLIREQKTHLIESIIQTNRRLGMVRLDDSIEDLLKKGLVSGEEAFEKSVQKERFVRYLREVPEEYRELLTKTTAG